MRSKTNSFLWTATLALAFIAQACDGSGGQVAGEDIDFTLIEAQCDADGKRMTVTMTAKPEDSEVAREVVRLDLDLDTVKVGETVDIADNPAALVSFEAVGPQDQLPERKDADGVRIVSGDAFAGTVTVDEANCDEPASASGSVDATLQGGGTAKEFKVDVSFATP